MSNVKKEVLAYKVFSRLPGVRPSDIRLTLHCGFETREVPVDENGKFEVEYDHAAFDANAMMVSKQPKGTITIRYFAEFDPSDALVELKSHIQNGRISYSELHRLAKAKVLNASKLTWARQLERTYSGTHEPALESSRPSVVENTFEESVIVICTTGDRTSKATLAKNHKNVLSEAYPETFSTPTGDPVLVQYSPRSYYMMCTNDLLTRNPEIVLAGNGPWYCILLTRAQIALLQR